MLINFFSIHRLFGLTVLPLTIICRQIGESAELVTIKNAGHAINVEKPKEMYKHMKSFLLDPLPQPKQEKQSNGHKVD